MSIAGHGYTAVFATDERFFMAIGGRHEGWHTGSVAPMLVERQRKGEDERGWRTGASQSIGKRFQPINYGGQVRCQDVKIEEVVRVALAMFVVSGYFEAYGRVKEAAVRKTPRGSLRRMGSVLFCAVMALCAASWLGSPWYYSVLCLLLVGLISCTINILVL